MTDHHTTETKLRPKGRNKTPIRAPSPEEIARVRLLGHWGEFFTWLNETQDFDASFLPGKPQNHASPEP